MPYPSWYSGPGYDPYGYAPYGYPVPYYVEDYASGPFHNVSIPGMPTGNPYMTGLQFGLLGAAAGLGYSQIHKTISRGHGALHTDPLAFKEVLGPMLAGAAMGTLMGMHISGRRKLEALSQRVDASTPKPVAPGGVKPLASSLSKIGQAQDVPWYDRFSLDNPNLGPVAQAVGTGAYFMPYAGTALAGWDTTRNLGKSIGNAAAGNWRQAGSNLLGAGASALFMLPVIGGFGRFLTRGGKALRVAKAAKGAGRMTRGMATLGRAARTTPSMRAAAQTAGRGMQWLGDVTSRGVRPLNRFFKTNPANLVKAPAGAGWIQKGLVGVRNLPYRGGARLAAGTLALGTGAGVMDTSNMAPDMQQQIAQFQRSGVMGNALQNQMFGPDWAQQKQQLQQQFQAWRPS